MIGSGRAGRPARRRSPLALLLPAAALAAIAVGPVAAFVQTNLVDAGQADVGLYQSGSTFTLRLEQDGSAVIADGSDMTALNAALQRWTDVATSSIVALAGAPFDLPDPIDVNHGLGTAGNRLAFAATDTTNHIGNAIAVAFYSMAADGHILDCDIVMNERLYTFTTTTPANPNQILGASTYDLDEIATHEIGHCLGLAHSPVAGRFSATTGLQVSGFTSGDFTFQATLYPYGTRTIQGRSLSDDDIAGASFIYPNATLNTTRGRITGRVVDGATFASIKGAHVVAVSTAAPDIPIVGAISGVEAGGPGGEYTLVGLAPGSYYVRIEPLVGTTNPFTEGNTPFTGFQTSFPWEWYDGASESGFDSQAARTAITLAAGQTVANVNLYTNVGAPDPNEPNNSRAAATTIACENVRAGSIVPLNDIDYYALTIADATQVTLDLSAARSGSTLDAIAAVMDGDGAILAIADNVLSLDPFLDVSLSEPGTYYVAIGSAGDEEFTGVGGQTAGSYTLTLSCAVPAIPQDLCRSHVLYAADGVGGSLMAIADADDDGRFDGLSTLYPIFGTGQGSQMISRADGGVMSAFFDGSIRAAWDDDGDFLADRVATLGTGFPDGSGLAGFRRRGAEVFYAGDLFSGGSVMEYIESTGDAVPEESHLFTADPESVFSLAVDEIGTVYALDLNYGEGLGAIRAYRDLDGDGAADTATVFATPAFTYGGLAARGPGELFVSDIGLGAVQRLVDRDLDGVADQATEFASGLAFDGTGGMTFDRADVLHVVDGGTRVLVLPDADHDGVADAASQFTPILSGLTGIAFGASPPDEVSLLRSGRPLQVTQAGTNLRITWEDMGPAVTGYNLYQGTLGFAAPPVALVCHVAGTPDGAGGRYVDLDPMPIGSFYYWVSASDACGEGPLGRTNDLVPRAMPPSACGEAD